MDFALGLHHGSKNLWGGVKGHVVDGGSLSLVLYSFFRPIPCSIGFMILFMKYNGCNCKILRLYLAIRIKKMAGNTYVKVI